MTRTPGSAPTTVSADAAGGVRAAVDAGALAQAAGVPVAAAALAGVDAGAAGSAVPDAVAAAAPIGVFDSGVGGLSVLRHIRAQLPAEDLLYFADGAFAPYGEKSEQVLAERALAIARFLRARGAKALVVACNTATVAAIKLLRDTWPDMPIVGVEPGLKPGAAATRSGKVGVMATEATLAGEKFLLLRDQITETSGAQFVLQGCAGLADAVDLGELSSEATVALLEGFIDPMLAAGADTLVLGCTHYPFVQQAIEDILQRRGAQHVVLVDTGDAVARQLARLLEGAGLLRSSSSDASGSLTGFTSGAAETLSFGFRTLLQVEAPVHEVPSVG